MLLDVHTALDLAADPEEAGENERVFVRGSYEYHHYGQVRCRPAWGSARRDASVTRLAACAPRASTTTAGDVPTAAARQFFRGVFSPLRARVCAGRISPDSVNL